MAWVTPHFPADCLSPSHVLAWLSFAPVTVVVVVAGVSERVRNQPRARSAQGVSPHLCLSGQAAIINRSPPKAEADFVSRVCLRLRDWLGVRLERNFSLVRLGPNSFMPPRCIETHAKIGSNIFPLGLWHALQKQLLAGISSLKPLPFLSCERSMTFP